MRLKRSTSPIEARAAQRGEPRILELRQVFFAFKDHDHMEMRMPAVSATAGHLCGRHGSDHAGLDPTIRPMPRPTLFRILHSVQQLRKIIVTTVTRGKREHHNPIALRPRPGEELVHLIAARLGNTSAAAWARPNRAAGL